MYKDTDLKIKVKKYIKNKKYMIQDILRKNNWFSDRGIILII